MTVTGKPPERKIPTLPIVAVLLALVAPTSPVRAEIQKAPDVTLTDMKGEKMRIDYKSAKVTLVNFWAVWCFPCKEEMPQIAKLMTKFGGQGLQAVGVALDSGGASEVKEFIDQHPEFGINYRIAVGTDDVAQKFGDVMAVPTTYLIDSSGRVLKTYIGVHGRFFDEVGGQITKALSTPGETAPKDAPAKKP